MTDFSVVELASEETHALRLEVLRNDTPSSDVVFAEDGMPGTIHIGVRDARGMVVGVSTWVPKPFNGAPAVQLRGMATSPELQGRGLGAMMLEEGCRRAASAAPVVWARARETALAFYQRHGFVVEGDGFIDEQTQKAHHIIVRRVRDDL
jgi:predicted GNAT family N-acyltransferase